MTWLAHFGGHRRENSVTKLESFTEFFKFSHYIHVNFLFLSHYFHTCCKGHICVIRYFDHTQPLYHCRFQMTLPPPPHFRALTSITFFVIKIIKLYSFLCFRKSLKRSWKKQKLNKNVKKWRDKKHLSSDCSKFERFAFCI